MRSDLLHTNRALRGEARRRAIEERIAPWVAWALIAIVLAAVILPLALRAVGR